MNDSNRGKNNKNALLLLAGAAIGAGATYFLHTPKGKQLTNDVMNKSKDVGGMISERAQTIATDAKTTANKAIESASQSFNMAKDSIMNQTSEILGKVETKANSFKSGIQKAKDSVNNDTIVS